MTLASDPAAPLFKPKGEAVYRHRVLTRVTHWINVLAIFILLMSGMQIFNAHPRLYWGQYGANADPAVLEMGAVDGPKGPQGLVRLFGKHDIDTTGVLGLSTVDGQLSQRGFPAWATLPSHQDLATGRRWHFFFAWLFVLNGAAYLIHTLLSGHLGKDLAPAPAELKPRHLLRGVWDHLRLKKPKGEEARRYNTLQKLAYLAVIFLILPLMLLTGLTMMPGMDAAWPWLVDLFGGRQSARTLHFVSATLVVLFILVHLFEVLISGVWNEVRSMITGWYVVRQPKAGDPS